MINFFWNDSLNLIFCCFLEDTFLEARTVDQIESLNLKVWSFSRLLYVANFNWGFCFFLLLVKNFNLKHYFPFMLRFWVFLSWYLWDFLHFSIDEEVDGFGAAIIRFVNAKYDWYILIDFEIIEIQWDWVDNKRFCLYFDCKWKMMGC